MRTTRSWVALLLLAVASACGDQLIAPKGAPMLLDPLLNITPGGTLDAEIDILTQALFPKGLETAAGTRWQSVKDKLAAGQPAEARAKFIELARWIESKNGQMDDPGTGETASAAATRLVSYMALYVYGGANTPVPAYNPGVDATFEVVEPTQADTVTTPAGYAGVGIEAGSVAVPTVITVSQSVQSYPGNCNGPLKTRMCQYPLFYDFHMFPQARFLKPVHVGVCHVHTGSARRPLDDPNHHDVHDRMRLAHPVPSNPANYTAGATQYSSPTDSIEVAPLSPMAGASGINCTNSPSYAMSAGARLLDRFASAIGRVLTPASLYAIDLGPEHNFEFFSPINLVDPGSQPDLSVGAASASSGSVLPGAGVSVSYNIYNTSPVHGGLATASSDSGSTAVYLSTDNTWSTGDALLGGAGGFGPMAPDATPIGRSATVTVPASTAPGSYFLVARAVQPIPEVSTTNNTAAVPLTVLGSAPLTAAPMGTILNAGSGTPTMDGQIGANEWNAAECGSIPVNTPQGGTTTAVFCAKNDATHVYFVYQLMRNVDDPGKSISAEFDTNADGVIGAWDDTFVHNPALGGLTDGVRVQCGTSICGPVDTAEGGQHHGSAAYGFHGSYAVYEVSKPLASGDGRDVSLMPGDAIGFFVDARLINGSTYPADYGDTRHPATGLMTLQLSGSTAVPNPSIIYTGSEQYATSPTALLDRYSFDVTNKASIPEALFDPMPGLPACGSNTDASRTWVDVLNAGGQVIYGFCGLGSTSDLGALWVAFSRWTLPTTAASIRLTDRLRGTTYTSSAVPLYGPAFNHFPRTLELNWAAMTGAVTYDTSWEFGNGCTAGDWTTCSSTWSPGATTTGLTGDSHTISFVGAQQGRWRVTGRDANGGAVGTSQYRYFRFTQ